MLVSAASIAVAKYADKSLQAAEISQNEAYRLFGRSNVDNWRNEGLCSFKTKGSSMNSKRYYNLDELNSLKALKKINLDTIHYIQ